jgi:hypothetical protein
MKGIAIRLAGMLYCFTIGVAVMVLACVVSVLLMIPAPRVSDDVFVAALAIFGVGIRWLTYGGPSEPST